ncbi:MAG: Ig-like domain-containing protein [Clostridiales bacterium]|nr:Ig-like domain-containing protein [Clostridiales bacterium]
MNMKSAVFLRKGKRILAGLLALVICAVLALAIPAKLAQADATGERIGEPLPGNAATMDWLYARGGSTLAAILLLKSYLSLLPIGTEGLLDWFESGRNEFMDLMANQYEDKTGHITQDIASDGKSATVTVDECDIHNIVVGAVLADALGSVEVGARNVSLSPNPDNADAVLTLSGANLQQLLAGVNLEVEADIKVTGTVALEGKFTYLGTNVTINTGEIGMEITSHLRAKISLDDGSIISLEFTGTSVDLDENDIKDKLEVKGSFFINFLDDLLDDFINYLIGYFQAEMPGMVESEIEEELKTVVFADGSDFVNALSAGLSGIVLNAFDPDDGISISISHAAVLSALQGDLDVPDPVVHPFPYSFAMDFGEEGLTNGETGTFTLADAVAGSWLEDLTQVKTLNLDFADLNKLTGGFADLILGSGLSAIQNNGADMLIGSLGKLLTDSDMLDRIAAELKTRLKSKLGALTDDLEDAISNAKYDDIEIEINFVRERPWPLPNTTIKQKINFKPTLTVTGASITCVKSKLSAEPGALEENLALLDADLLKDWAAEVWNNIRLHAELYSTFSPGKIKTVRYSRVSFGHKEYNLIGLHPEIIRVMEVGETLPLHPELVATLHQGGVVVYTYESADESVATVDEYGEITAVGAGTTTITVTATFYCSCGCDYVKSVDVSVIVYEELDIVENDDENDDEMVVTYGDDDFPLILTGGGTGANTWSSNNACISVDADGNVNINSVGVAIVTVEQEGDDIYPGGETSIKITVLRKPIIVVADDQMKYVGQTDPAQPWGWKAYEPLKPTDPPSTKLSVPGLETGDTLAGSLKRAPGETVGDYAITENIPFANPNYAIEFVQGTFSILEHGKTGEGDVTTLIILVTILALSTSGLGVMLIRRRKVTAK